MKKFKFFFIATIAAIALTIVGYIASSGDKTPDAGLAVLNFILLGIVLMGLGLLVDLFLLFTRSSRPVIRERKPFWQIIIGLVLLGVIYFIYVQGST